MSSALRAILSDVATTLGRRASYDRCLYSAAVRSLAEAGDIRVVPVLLGALQTEHAGGTATVSAACSEKAAPLAAPLAKLAGAQKSHLAFGAEVARVLRGESSGARLLALAPMIKESHRLELCAEVLLPLARRASSAKGLCPALGVLRGAERHLGRWLVLAEVAKQAGDASPLEEARTQAAKGPDAARSAWTLVAWALDPATPLDGARLRPTSELIARLSDRPSSDRDPSFLFRLAEARSEVARPMLEALAKGTTLDDVAGVRAALLLSRHYGRDDLRGVLTATAASTKREDVRGLATAALWDVGEREKALSLCDELLDTKSLPSLTWVALVRAEARRGQTDRHDLVTETRTRWIQWGRPE